MGRICFDCGKPITVQDYRMVGLDIPYVNLFFHRDCLFRVGGYSGINVYLAENIVLCYNYIEKLSKNRKK